MNVIKLGGSVLDDKTRRTAVLCDLAAAWNRGEQMVLVHGGGKHIDAMLVRLGIPKRTCAGLRITDDATLDVVVSVLGGFVNKLLVSELTSLGIRAAGVSGSDAGTLIAEKHPPIDGIDLLNVGCVTSSNCTLIRAMLTYGILPVVSSVAQNSSGALLNVNADTAAAAIAVGLRAHSLRFITDVAGLLDGTGSVVPQLTSEAVAEYLASDIVSGGMRPKLQAALTAMRGGVQRIAIGESAIGAEGGTNLVAA